jgi:uncharacterized membrane protein YuzA (DUF378 family)
MKYLKTIAYIIVLLGAFNWGIYGLFDFDIIQFTLGTIPLFARIIYVSVGLSALYIVLNRYVLCTCLTCNTCAINNDCECNSKDKK